MMLPPILPDPPLSRPQTRLYSLGSDPKATRAASVLMSSTQIPSTRFAPVLQLDNTIIYAGPSSLVGTRRKSAIAPASQCRTGEAVFRLHLSSRSPDGKLETYSVQ